MARRRDERLRNVAGNAHKHHHRSHVARNATIAARSNAIGLPIALVGRPFGG